MKLSQIVIRAPLPSDAPLEIRNDIHGRIAHLQTIVARVCAALAGLEGRTYALDSGSMTFCINGTTAERATLEDFFGRYPELGIVQAAELPREKTDETTFEPEE